jgi:hypothetical protein
MVREHTQIELNFGAPPDASQDGITLAAADAWDPRGAFEKAPVFTKEALVAEQSKRAQEGRPLLGRFVLEAPAGNDDAPVDYAKATMRALRNALGRDINNGNRN